MQGKYAINAFYWKDLMEEISFLVTAHTADEHREAEA